MVSFVFRGGGSRVWLLLFISCLWYNHTSFGWSVVVGHCDAFLQKDAYSFSTLTHLHQCGITTNTVLSLKGGGSDDDDHDDDDDDTHEKQKPDAVTTFAAAEVVGATGRVGSFFLRASASKAILRGVSAGIYTHVGQPIYVCVPSSSWSEIYHRTPIDRRNDLVWIGNGLLMDGSSKNDDDDRSTTLLKQDDTTVVIPHFGILSHFGEPVTSKQSPSTYVYGKHAISTMELLKRHGVVSIQHIEDWPTMKKFAARKLLWASCMWLLCHDQNDDDAPSSSSPLTVTQVHQQRQADLERLVQELYPTYLSLLQQQQEKTVTTMDEGVKIEEMESILEYMSNYSYSMPNATPSKELAMKELMDRNGKFYHPNQTFHRYLLRKQGAVVVEQLLEEEYSENQNNNKKSNKKDVFEIQHLNRMRVWGSSRRNLRHNNHNQQQPPRSIIIVGGGILGTSLALNLARRQRQQKGSSTKVNITVLDELIQQGGRTTRASWAWLNANPTKSPLSYRYLNELGMMGWMYDNTLEPTWNGALVQYSSSDDDDADNDKILQFGDGGRQGPLTKQEILELEPTCNFMDEDGPNVVYYYPQDGNADPLQSVASMRDEAERLGCCFVQNASVTRFIIPQHDDDYDDDTSHQVTVEIENGTQQTADVVVVAAGIGSRALANIPLQQPNKVGQVVFVNNGVKSVSNKKNQSPAVPPKLNHMLVDTVRQVHVLQRQDGTFVMGGGGALQVGGEDDEEEEEIHPSNGSSSSSSKSETCFNVSVDQQQKGAVAAILAQRLLNTTKMLVPSILNSTTHPHRVESAIRPIPQDGLPCVGWLAGNNTKNVYCMVTHSGVTLSPILGAMAAVEILDGMELEVLGPYRPQRFSFG